MPVAAYWHREAFKTDDILCASVVKQQQAGGSKNFTGGAVVLSFLVGCVDVDGDSVKWCLMVYCDWYRSFNSCSRDVKLI